VTGPSNETRLAAGALLRGRALAGPHLAVREGPDAGKRFALLRDQTLGRGRSADLRLSDAAASRVHVRITQIDGRVVLADLRSKNGVRVNGRRCRGSRPLAPGDEVAIGATRLTLEPGLLVESEGRAPSPAPAPPAEEAPPRGRSARSALPLLAAAAALIAAALLML